MSTTLAGASCSMAKGNRCIRNHISNPRSPCPWAFPSEPCKFPRQLTPLLLEHFRPPWMDAYLSRLPSQKSARHPRSVHFLYSVHVIIHQLYPSPSHFFCILTAAASFLPAGVTDLPEVPCGLDDPFPTLLLRAFILKHRTHHAGSQLKSPRGPSRHT